MSDAAGALHNLDAELPPGVEAAFAKWYGDIKELARAQLKRANARGQLQTTQLVHDSYLRLAEREGLLFKNRLQFLAYASRTLRHVLIDQLREQRALRRGGGREMLTLDTAVADRLAVDLDVESLHDAIESLAALDPAKARLVELRFFGGLTETEVADLLGCSVRSLQREWSKARALLLTFMESH